MGDRSMDGSARPHANPAAAAGGIDRMGSGLSVFGVVELTGLYSHSLAAPAHRLQGCPSLLLVHWHSSQKK